jgi:hypothetical protein
MGTWNTGILDDDLAMDIKDEFDDAIEDGLSVIDATRQVLESFEDVLEDDDDSAILFLVLAALQLGKGAVQKDIRQKALEIIECEQGLGRWKYTGEDELSNRVRELNDLKDKLMN